MGAEEEETKVWYLWSQHKTRGWGDDEEPSVNKSSINRGLCHRCWKEHISKSKQCWKLLMG